MEFQRTPLPRNWPTIVRCWVTLLTLISCLIAPAHAEEPDLETRLKVALVYKLPKFVQWPAATFATPEQAFKLCVIGSDEHINAFNTLQGRTLLDRTVVVERKRANAPIDTQCQVLYIGQSEQPRLNAVLKPLRGQSVLTVSDIADFAKQGGNIEIHRANSRLVLRINLNSSTRAGLKLASQLLEIATIVNN